jgi:hypothetical protein
MSTILNISLKDYRFLTHLLRLLNYWEYGSRTISNGIHTFIRLFEKPVKSYSTYENAADPIFL